MSTAKEQEGTSVSSIPRGLSGLFVPAISISFTNAVPSERCDPRDVEECLL